LGKNFTTEGTEKKTVNPDLRVMGAACPCYVRGDVLLGSGFARLGMRLFAGEFIDN
jgi:hypothetical protein